MKTRTVVFAGLAIALLSVSALFAVPFGTIPFTLQTAVIVLIVLIGTPVEALTSIAGYLLIGVVGLPVFSGGRGGLGVILGPTGGFLHGFFLGALVALVLKSSLKSFAAKGKLYQIARDVLIAIVALAISYLCGWVHLSLTTGVTFNEAFLVGVAPFLLFEIPKVALAVTVAQPLQAAFPK